MWITDQSGLLINLSMATRISFDIREVRGNDVYDIVADFADGSRRALFRHNDKDSAKVRYGRIAAMLNVVENHELMGV